MNEMSTALIVPYQPLVPGLTYLEDQWALQALKEGKWSVYQEYLLKGIYRKLMLPKRLIDGSCTTKYRN